MYNTLDICAQDEHTFIGFDCAYRTLGWCILGYNPRSLTRAIHESNAATNGIATIGATTNGIAPCARDLFCLRAGGVEDVLGQKIDEVDHAERAIRLATTLRAIIPASIVARSTVIIERQPRKRGRGFSSAVHDTNQTVEAQLVFYFSAVCRARKVYLISAGKKNKVACALLREPPVTTYDARKKQSRRAYVRLAEHFNFDAHSRACDFPHVRADRADACVQIIAGIFLCAKSI